MERTGEPLARQVEAALDSATRNKGLLGRVSLAEDAALVIAPSNAVHTWFMRFHVDLVFATRDGIVVKIRHRVGPWRLSVALRASAVVELAAGRAAAAGLTVGDRLVLRVASAR